MVRGKQLRGLLKGGKGLSFVGAHNPFAAKLIERAGFEGVYLSGAGLSNSLGATDTGIIGLADFSYMGKKIAAATKLPLISDADTGFGNHTGTVRAYIEAGISALHIEDQAFPKRCGHLPGKEVIPQEEMEENLRIVTKERDKLDRDFAIIARTDAKGAVNVDEKDQFADAVRRGKAYRKAGADVIFPESLRTKEEFAAYRKEVEGPLLANMTEFGKTPYMTAKEFHDLGYQVVIFPVSLFRYLAGCAERGLARMRADGFQKNIVDEMMSRNDINRLLEYHPGENPDGEHKRV